jgi:hypothetical protein
VCSQVQQCSVTAAVAAGTVVCAHSVAVRNGAVNVAVTAEPVSAAAAAALLLAVAAVLQLLTGATTAGPLYQ